MSNVQFDEQKMGQDLGGSGKGGMAGFLIRKGIAKSQTQANVLLIILALIFFTAAAIVAISAL
mgnify:CR=1 FL=1